LKTRPKICYDRGFFHVEVDRSGLIFWLCFIMGSLLFITIVWLVVRLILDRQIEKRVIKSDAIPDRVRSFVDKYLSVRNDISINTNI
jgi:hypothetical protein